MTIQKLRLSKRLAAKLRGRMASLPAIALLQLAAWMDAACGCPYTEPENKVFRKLNWHVRRTVAILATPLLSVSNRYSTRSLLGDGPPVSLTSHGSRVKRSFVSIESIGLGKVKPREIILWLNSYDEVSDLPEPLRRLRHRNLTIKVSDDFGPHTKYFPYVQAQWDGLSPLVTADDDLIYPPDWLKRLATAGGRFPQAVNAHRAHLVGLDRDGDLIPYALWRPCRDSDPDFTTFATGLSGVWYPPSVLAALRERGTAFREVTPRADDVWLHFVAITAGVPIRQIRKHPRHWPVIRGSQFHRLQAYNIDGGGNNQQIRATYTVEARLILQNNSRDR